MSARGQGALGLLGAGLLACLSAGQAGCAGLRHDAGPVDARRQQILDECRYAAALGRAAAAGAPRLEQTLAGTEVFGACLRANHY